MKKEMDRDVSALYSACRNGNIGEVKKILEAKASYIKSHPHFSARKLIYAAACKKSMEMIQIFLQYSVLNLEKRFGIWGNTSLHEASIIGFSDLVKFLLHSKLDVNSLNFNDCTPLIVAAISGQIDVLMLLVRGGAEIDFKYNGETALKIATNAGNADIMKLLLENQANVNSEDNSGNTPLHYCKNFRSLKLLLLFGADHNIINNNGFSASEVIDLKLSKKIPVLVKEIEKMKSIKLSNYTSLYNVLWMRQYNLAHYVYNKTLKQMYRKRNTFRAFFFNYGPYIDKKYHKAVQKRKLLDEAKYSFQTVSSFYLPDACYDEIFLFLNNKELSNLSASKKYISLKRKRQKRTELKIKLKKGNSDSSWEIAKL